jgi:hypothetical protein
MFPIAFAAATVSGDISQFDEALELSAAETA